MRRLFRTSPQQTPALPLQPTPWNLDTPLLPLSKKDVFSIRSACQGLLVTGAIGAGKSSGPGKAFAGAYLRAGFGGLVLCSKRDERDTWLAYALATGRTGDVVLFDASKRVTYNFLDHEMTRPGEGAGLTENIVRLFDTIIAASDMQRGGKAGNADPFWQDSLKQMLRNAVDLCALARGTVSVPLLYQVITSAAKNDEQVHDPSWQHNSICHKLINEATEKSAAGRFSKSQERDFEITGKYWMQEFPNLAEKTRSIIEISFTSLADLFLRGLLADLFSTSTTVRPEDAFQGKIIILDLPVLEFGDVGRIAASVFKYSFQRAVLRRDVKQHPRPVFLWADEAQVFLSPFDEQFQAQCRSQRGATVYLTQNLPLIRRVMRDHDTVSALLGNLQNKIWLQNGDTATNKDAAETLSRDWHTRSTLNEGIGHSGLNMGSTIRQTLDYLVQPVRFTTLKKGGPQNNFIVEGIMYRGGESFKASGKSYQLVSFSQK